MWKCRPVLIKLSLFQHSTVLITSCFCHWTSRLATASFFSKGWLLVLLQCNIQYAFYFAATANVLCWCHSCVLTFLTDMYCILEVLRYLTQLPANCEHAKRLGLIIDKLQCHSNSQLTSRAADYPSLKLTKISMSIQWAPTGCLICSSVVEGSSTFPLF